MKLFQPLDFAHAIQAVNTNAEERPYLGCSLRSNNDKPGMMILLVNTESPAYHANMKVGDILLEANG